MKQEHAYMSDGVLVFTKKFLSAVAQQQVEADPTGADDGIERRWVSSPSGIGQEHPAPVAVNGELIHTREPSKKCGYGVIVTSPPGIDTRQLLPVNEVGTGRHVSKKSDLLIRTHRQKPAIQISAN